jgi:enoyl-CoA hydratase/carnithine racemase
VCWEKDNSRLWVHAPVGATWFEFKIATDIEAPLSCCLAYANELADQPIVSLVATKKLLIANREKEVMEAHHREMKAFASGLVGGPANREAIQAFAEKRKADFSSLAAVPTRSKL